MNKQGPFPQDHGAQAITRHEERLVAVPAHAQHRRRVGLECLQELAGDALIHLHRVAFPSRDCDE